MNKEFIPYEQALALKGLGFDEQCFSFYNAIGELYESEGYYSYSKNVHQFELDFIDKVFVCHFCKQRHKDDVLYRVFTCGEYYQHWDFENQKGCAENKNNIDPFGNYHKQFNPNPTMNDIEFVFEIETEAGSFEVPMYFSAHDWFDDDSGDIPEVHYTDIGFDKRQKEIIHDLRNHVGTEHDGGLLSAMQKAADWWESHNA